MLVDREKPLELTRLTKHDYFYNLIEENTTKAEPVAEDLDENRRLGAVRGGSEGHGARHRS